MIPWRKTWHDRKVKKKTSIIHSLTQAFNVLRLKRELTIGLVFQELVT